jgi:hypothetical protein
MKFAISSHKDYMELTEHKVVESLINSGVPPEDIYFFIGGYEGEYQKLEGGYNRYSCPHNSMDFTGLISLIELNIESDYWFLLHDTCYVGSKFYKVVTEYPYGDKKYISLDVELSMNMGAYRWDYIQEKKQDIVRYKNTSDSLQEYKTLLIMDEDIFFRPKEYHFNVSRRQSSDPTDYYNNGTDRIIEYFPNIDLHKVKANWCLKDIYVNKP